MARRDPYRLSYPQVHLWRMILFLIISLFVVLILYESVFEAFMANPGLNGLIIAVGMIGIALAFRQVLRLFREISWVNRFRAAQPDMPGRKSPVLLAPMATLFRDGVHQTVLSAVTMRTVLDTVGTRLDEARDISRYLTGLLVFLGLLGTFWGLLQTVSSIGATIQSLDVGSSDAGVLFEDLKTGLQAPLTGMGTAFSSSLFGLTGSLIVGFLDLQAGQAQNRFYTELEDWLSTLTEIIDESEAGAGTGAANIEAAIDRLSKLMEESAGAAQSRAATKAMASLAEGIQGLVKHLRSEQKLMREWADAQTEQNERMEQLLTKLNEALDAEHTT